MWLEAARAMEKQRNVPLSKAWLSLAKSKGASEIDCLQLQFKLASKGGMKTRSSVTIQNIYDELAVCY